MDDQNQQIRDLVADLPAALQTAARDRSWENDLRAIANKHGFTPEQVSIWIDETLLVLMGALTRIDYAKNLALTLGLPNETCAALAREVEEKIFQPLDKPLQLLQQNKTRDERFEKLPPNIQQAISSADNERAIQEIGKKYALHIDQLGLLDDEVNLVLLGDTPSNQFVEKIKNVLRIDGAQAQAVGQEVSERIFMPLRDSLRALSEPPTSSIVEQKLGGTFSLPVEKKIDPYHEPID
ncbi:MAG: hypothetical protein HYT48_00410 [Candidatus Vogelbacteria bacterium]|nr:hypothetical protein [Candidatus Vogelbacteria bacterium]